MLKEKKNPMCLDIIGTGILHSNAQNGKRKKMNDNNYFYC